MKQIFLSLLVLFGLALLSYGVISQGSAFSEKVSVEVHVSNYDANSSVQDPALEKPGEEMNISNSAVLPLSSDSSENIAANSESDAVCNLTLSGSGGSFSFDNIPSNGNAFGILPDGDYIWSNLCWNSTDITLNSFSNFHVGFDISLNLSLVSLVNTSLPFSAHASPQGFLQLLAPLSNVSYSVSATSLAASDLSLPGMYSLKLNDSGTLYNLGGISFSALPLPVIKNFSLAAITFNISQARVNESFNVSVTLISPQPIVSYNVSFGDDSRSFSVSGNFTFVSNVVSKNYSSPGTYPIALHALIAADGKYYPVSYNSSVVVEDAGAPSLTLLSPEDGTTFSLREITFNYSAYHASFCSFELYNKSSDFGILLYSLNTSSPENVSVPLVKFDEGEYYWEVNCHNNESTVYEGRGFSVRALPSQAAPYQQSDEVQKTLARLNDFLAKMDGYQSEDRNALDELGISAWIDASKKRVLQIDTDLANNLRGLDAEKKEKRIQEMMGEIKNISDKTPLEFSVLANDEYVKYTPTQNFENIFEGYLNAEHIVPQGGNTAFIAANKHLQANVTVSAHVRHIEMTYAFGKQQMTLVTKEIKTSAPFILEAIPKDIAANASSLVFLVPATIVLDDPLVKFDAQELHSGKIAYLLPGHIDFIKIRDIDTLGVFTPDTGKDTLLTGFSVSLGNNVHYLWILFLIPLFIFGIFIARIAGSKRGFKDERLKEISHLIKQIQQKLRDKDAEGAGQIYKEIHLLFSELTPKKKKLVTKKIHYLYEEILFMRAKVLVRDCISLLKEKKKREALYTYSLLQKIYPHLPPAHKAEVYRRITSLSTLIQHL